MKRLILVYLGLVLVGCLNLPTPPERVGFPDQSITDPFGPNLEEDVATGSESMDLGAEHDLSTPADTSLSFGEMDDSMPDVTLMDAQIRVDQGVLEGGPNGRPCSSDDVCDSGFCSPDGVCLTCSKFVEFFLRDGTSIGQTTLLAPLTIESLRLRGRFARQARLELELSADCQQVDIRVRERRPNLCVDFDLGECEITYIEVDPITAGPNCGSGIFFTIDGGPQTLIGSPRDCDG